MNGRISGKIGSIDLCYMLWYTYKPESVPSRGVYLGTFHYPNPAHLITVMSKSRMLLLSDRDTNSLLFLSFAAAGSGGYIRSTKATPSDNQQSTQEPSKKEEIISPTIPVLYADFRTAHNYIYATQSRRLPSTRKKAFWRGERFG